jgi:hypothetical protein
MNVGTTKHTKPTGLLIFVYFVCFVVFSPSETFVSL